MPTPDYPTFGAMMADMLSDPGKRIEREEEETTESVLASMLTQNTGRHILDSGGAYGRHWERNQSRNFENEADSVFKVECAGGRHAYLAITHNVYHFCKAALDFNPELDAQYVAWVEANDSENDMYDIQRMEAFAESIEGAAGIYGDGAPMTVNTYNGEDLLSQVLQYVYWEDNDGGHVLLQIHGGADVRGGYSDPRAFDSSAMELCGLFDNARASVGCTGCYFRADMEDGHTLSAQDVTDFGWKWEPRIITLALELPDGIPNYAPPRDPGSILYCDENGLPFCPLCGKPLVSCFY